MDTQIHGVGPNSDQGAQVDNTSLALRVSLKPTDYNPVFGGVIGGHYKIAGNTGTMAAGIATGASIFQVRWADPSRLFILLHLTVDCCTGTGFAATSQGCPLDLCLAHGSTANGSGGSALAITSISNKMRAAMASSAFATSGEIRIATTAALTIPTGAVYESNPIGICMGAPNATLQRSGPLTLFETSDMGDHPLILSAGDSLAIRANNPAATGTWYAAITMEWMEAMSF